MRVRKALGGNSNITIVAVEEKNYLMGRGGSWGHTVDFYVAPKNKSIYAAEELQTFMLTLIPSGMEPTCRDDFCENDRAMELGKLYFDEDIGAEFIHREITLNKDVLPEDGFVNGKKITESIGKIKRRILVRLFPDIQTAAEAVKKIN